MTRTLALILTLLSAQAMAQPGDTWLPDYQVYIAPADPQTGKEIPKGEVASTDVNEVCAGKGAYRNTPYSGGTYSQNHRLSQNEETKRLVMQQSGVPWEDRAHYEDDHYCPLGLGCSDSIRNRWAQPRFGTWNSAKKDKLETRAIELVCDGKVDLHEAQSWFNTTVTPDWRTIYCAQFPDDVDCAEIVRH
jgi:hypothetical protein